MFGRLRARVNRADVKNLALLTLTQRNTEDLTDGREQLLAAWNKYRHSRWWKKHVLGGWKVEESTCKAHGWHPHLHIIIEHTGWFPIREARARWSAATGGSMVIDFRPCYGDLNKVARYVGKYLSKGAEIEDPLKAAEYRYEMAGKRLHGAIGKWYGCKEEPKPIIRDPRWCGDCLCLMPAVRIGTFVEEEEGRIFGVP